MSKDKKGNKRYIGKVKSFQGSYGDFQKILMDNPNPKNEDGSLNQYCKGVLVWKDMATGKNYLVKSLSFTGVSEQSAERGFTASICIDLENSYDVTELK